jgi:putative heme-binding domain-containing protein
MNLTKKLCEDLSLEEARIFVSEGAKWPNAALISLYRYPEQLSPEDLASLTKLDQEIDRKGFEAEQFKRLRTGIVAMLSSQGTPESQAYLRDVWVRSPERRQAIALGLAQYPTDENWDYLIRSLPVLESFAVGEVMNALKKIQAATDDAQAIREVILHGLRMQQTEQPPTAALELLSYWRGQEIELSSSTPTEQLEEWQVWFAKTYPNEPPAELPKAEKNSPWNIDTLSEFFGSSEGRRGHADAGKMAFTKAKCADCHKAHGGIGQPIGPDLATIYSRFTSKEVLESILFPSHVISDQYRSSRVLTTDGKVYTGLMTTGANGELSIRDSQLQTHTIAAENVESVEPSKTSMMPTGLIDQLTAVEIRDLMTFLGYVPEQIKQVAQLPDTSAVKPSKQ